MGKTSKRTQEESGPKRKRICQKETCDSPTNDQNRSFDQLPVNVVRSILERVSFKDVDRAKDVSSFWKSVAKSLLKQRQYLKSPWFIYHDNSVPGAISPFVIANDEEHNTYPLSKTTSDLFLECPYIGSSRGWLIFLKHETLNPILFNPITEARIQIPTLRSFAGYSSKGNTYLYNWKEVIWKDFIPKIILTADPHHSDYGVVLNLARQKLGYYKNGKHRWKQLGDSFLWHRVHHYHDILYYRSKLYVLHIDPYEKYPSIDIWDLQDCRLIKKETFGTKSFFMDNMGIKILCPRACTFDDDTLKVEEDFLKLYLVELGGEILLVSRFVEKFEALVCKLDLNKEKGGVRLFSLGGDKSLVLSRNQSMAISTKGLQWYKGNSIYFTHDIESSNQLDLYELRNHDGT